MMTDPIADMLTRIRNALSSSKPEVRIPYSKLKFIIAKLLEKEGYLAQAEKVRSRIGAFDEIHINLKHTQNGSSALRALRRISKPGRRLYCGYQEIRKMSSGRGMIILSTPQGIMTDQEARKRKLGGEVICEVY